MARDFVLGNGKILVCLDKNSQIRDFYYPHVGQENHVNGKTHKLGIWVDNQFSWFDSDLWDKKNSYKKETLVTDVSAVNDKLGLQVLLNDTVHCEKDIFLRKIVVKNKLDQQRDVKIFLHQIFQITGDTFGNTVYDNPELKSVIFYKGQRYFLINGSICNEEKHGISCYTAGTFEKFGLLGTYVDAQDGKLANNPIEHGSVDSTISFNFTLPASGEQTVYYWICVGEKNHMIMDLNDFVLEKEPETLIKQTDKYWVSWVNREKFNFFGLKEDLIDLFKRCLLIVNTHIDHEGAFIASGDSGTLHLQKDTYAYMWPRDGALIARSLDRAGYSKITENFFKFCCKALTKGGYLFHKYNPDGSLGSSWHAWIHEGHFQLPIQEDQIALVLDAMWKHYLQHKNDEYMRNIYQRSIKSMANFMFNFIDEKIGLPKESYDLWEEKLGIHTFTCTAVYAGFKAAANFENVFGTKQDATKYEDIAEKIKKNILKYFYDEKRNVFIKGIYYKDGEIYKDETIDSSSMYGIFEFNVLDAGDPRLKSSFDVFKEKLTCPTSIGGYARYENDTYYRVNQDGPGNPWFITSLWLAEYYIALAQNIEQLNPALEILNWVTKYKLDTGVLSEQLNPNSGEPLSVAPLTWSHAAFVVAITKYLQKLDSLGIAKMLNPPKIKTEEV